MQWEHEADAAGEKSFSVALERSCILMNSIADAMITVFEGIRVFPDRMKANLELSGGLIMSERIMLVLGNEMGRQRAHDVVYEAAQRATNENCSFKKTLAEEAEISSRLSAEEINELLNPETYTGLCGYFVDSFVTKAREISGTLR
jgi:adenylosuccinate lyase